jgi:uncharacterized membrane protein
MSQFISLRRWAGLGRPESEIATRTARRVVLIFFTGLLFATAIWGPRYVFDWDILTFIGFSILALYPLRRLRPGYLPLIAAGVVAASPLLREWAHYSHYWDAAYTEYSHDFTSRDVFLGFWVNGYFPVFPWLTFPLLGFATGRWFLVVSGRKRGQDRWLLLAGSCLVVLAGVAVLVNSTLQHAQDTALQPQGALGWYVSGLEFYPATTTFVVGTLGVVLLLFWLLRTLLDLRPAAGRAWMTFFRRYSRFSLTTYVVHHAVHVWPLIVMGTTPHHDKWYYYGDAVSPLAALLLAVTFVALFYVALIVWERRGARYSFEWILGRLVGR